MQFIITLTIKCETLVLGPARVNNLTCNREPDISSIEPSITVLLIICGMLSYTNVSC